MVLALFKQFIRRFRRVVCMTSEPVWEAEVI